MSNIVVTGGSGRFGKILKQSGLKYKFPKKKEFNILSVKSIEKYLKRVKPYAVLHLAGLSRPLSVHEEDIVKSIKLNIIGTSNVVIACKKFNIKVIYFSSSYVYPGTKGNYKESDPVLPFNNYAWSKLGGESSVHMYKNSLIIRACMTEKPFIHKKAISDVYLNFIFQDEVAKILPKLIRLKGILNLGGPIKSVYHFAKKFNPSVKKISLNQIKDVAFKKNMSMNISKLRKILKK